MTPPPLPADGGRHELLPTPVCGGRWRAAPEGVLLQQLAQPLDHPHRLGCRMRRDAGVERVVPDAAQAEPLRRLDLPFVIVADHPGVAGVAAQALERVAVDVRLGLAQPELALDL